MDMGAGTHYGFATMSTDNGHRSGPNDVSWIYKSPEKEVDWAWRAMHGSVQLAKQVVATYYGEDIQYSYYTGCSTGGRQGLKEAQLDADSFDGMLVGAPAWWISHLVSWATKMTQAYFPLDDPKSVPADLLPLISSTVVGQCDAVDGVEDGIVSSPERCHPDLEVLNCDNAGANSSACLTPLQLETLQKFYSDYYVGTELAYPGFDLSSEIGWGNFLWNDTPLSYGLDYLRAAVFEDPDWPLAAYNDSVYEYVIAKDLGHPEPDDFDMSAYRDKGGKILMYHGISDPLIVTRGSTHLYEQVKLATGVAHPIADWFKFFLVPGMSHCYGTAVDAPWYFNGAGQSFVLGSGQYSVPGFKDPRHDALLALVEWVEHGKDVDQIIATSWNVMTDPSSGISRQRPLCPYPKKAVYDGLGNVDEADSWNCEYS